MVGASRTCLAKIADLHPHPCHCSPPPPSGEKVGARDQPGRFRFPEGSVWRTSLTGPPSPSFASGIPGDPKSLGWPLNWALNPQPPRRPEPSPSGRTARRGSHCPPPLPQLAACAVGKNSKPGSRAPPPGTACAPLPELPRWSCGVGTPAGAGRDPRTPPLRCAPAARSCPGGRREAEATGPGCAPVRARAAKGRGLLEGEGVFPEGALPSRRRPEAGWEWRVRLRAAGPKAVPAEDGRGAPVRVRVQSSRLSAAHKLHPACGAGRPPSMLLPSHPGPLPNSRFLQAIPERGTVRRGGGEMPPRFPWILGPEDDGQGRSRCLGLCCP